MSLKVVSRLARLTSVMRTHVIDGKQITLTDLSTRTGLSISYIEDLLSLALATDYRDEQLEIFCSQITYYDPISATNELIKCPPLKIMMALTGNPAEPTLGKQYTTPEGQKILSAYITRMWKPRVAKWLAQLEKDLVQSKLREYMAQLYPETPLPDLSNMKGPTGLVG